MNNDSLLLSKCNDILYEQVKISLLTNIVAGVLYSSIMLNVIPHATIILWLTILVVISAIRVFMVYQYHKLENKLRNPELWHVIFIFSVAITGSIWGSTLLLLPEDVPIYTTITVLFLCGLSSGAVAVLSISRLAYLAFMIPALVPGMIALFLADSYLCNVLSLTILIYFLFLTLSVINTNRRLVSSLVLEIENNSLIEKLSVEKNRIEKFNEELENQVEARTIELKEINTKLRISEEQFKSAFINSPLGMALVDKSGVIMKVNPRSFDVLGYLPEELVGQSIKDLTHPDDFEQSQKLFKQLISGEIKSYQIEKRYKHKKDGYVWTRLSISVVRDTNNEILHAIALIEDITEQLSKEAQLIHAQKMEVVGQLTGGIAHDFNNLLTIIIGNLKFLKEEVEHTLKKEDQEFIDAALTAAKDSANLTHGLLAVSRKQLLQPKNIEVNSIIDEVVYMIKRTLGTNIDINVNKHINPVSVYADPTQLKNALFNLAINARDAMPNGGDIGIDVQCKEINENSDLESLEQGSYVIISVKDSGIGMTEEEIEKVFDPFFTTKETGRGTGLGLSTVYGFSKQSNGKTTIESTPGKGTSVSIFLPTTDAGKEILLNDTLNHNITNGTETILVTEDEAGIRMLAVKMLSNLGYTVLEAENADAAIEMINAGNNIDLLFSDIMMPGDKSGHDLSAWVLENHPDIKILLTSGFNKNPYKGNNELVASIPILNKPYSRSQLSLHIRAVLDM